MSARTAIRLAGVRKRYRDGTRSIDAASGVSCRLEVASIGALIGPSGSGKTTLLGLMGAMIAPTEGEIEVLGKAVSHLRDHHRTELRRRSVGFVFQELALVPRMTVMENVLLPLVPTGGAPKSERERALSLLDRFGLRDRAASRAEQLSGGQRQRAALARALVLDPPILLLDEPTAHLDSESAAGVVALLAELRDEGRTIVLATHDARVYDDPRIDRVLRIADGAIAADSQPQAT